MKIQIHCFKSRHRQNGLITLVFIALLGIMMILVAANVRTLVHLYLTEKLIEQKQIQRLNASQTNAVTVATQPNSK